METLATLLGGAVVHVLRDADPVVRALFTDQLSEELIFLWHPRATTV